MVLTFANNKLTICIVHLKPVEGVVLVLNVLTIVKLKFYKDNASADTEMSY